MNTEIHVPPQTELPNPTIDISQLTLDQAEQFRKVEIQYNTSDDKLINIDRLTASARRELDKILEDEMSTLQDLAFQDKFDIVLEKYQTLIDTEKNTLQEKKQITRQHKRNASRRKTIDEIQKIELVEPFLDQEFVSETKIKMYKTIIGKAKYQHKLEELAQREGVPVDQLKKSSAADIAHRLKIAREKATENSTSALEFMAQTPDEEIQTAPELVEQTTQLIPEGISDIAIQLDIPTHHVAEIIANTAQTVQKTLTDTLQTPSANIPKKLQTFLHIPKKTGRTIAATLTGILLNLSPSPVSPIEAHAPMAIIEPTISIPAQIPHAAATTAEFASTIMEHSPLNTMQDTMADAIQQSKQHITTQQLKQRENTTRAFGPSGEHETAIEIKEKNIQHLLDVYGPQMNKTGNFRDEQHKKEFFTKLVDMAHRMNPNNPYLANQLAAAIHFESGFSSSIQNHEGSGATGLLQYTENTANWMGTTTTELRSMDPVQQLPYAEKYFKGVIGSRPLSHISDVYMSIFSPAYVGTDPNKFMNLSPKTYAQNYKQLDKNRDGGITPLEASLVVINAAIAQGETLENLGLQPQE